MKLKNNQLKLIKHLIRFNLLDYQDCLKLLDTENIGDNVAVSLNIETRQSDEKIDGDSIVSKNKISVSNFDIKIKPEKTLKPHFLKGFSAFEISKIRHILSDCKEIYLLKDSILNKRKVKIFPLKC